MENPTEETFTERQAHRRFAVNLFNHVWSLLEKERRTAAEDDRMLHAAHASRFHWEEVGDASNLGIGEWQISRVYAVLGRPEPANHHAQRYLSLSREHDLGPFHLGFAYEALARAASVAGDGVECTRYLELAREAGERIDDAEERQLLFSDLATIQA